MENIIKYIKTYPFIAKPGKCRKLDMHTSVILVGFMYEIWVIVLIWLYVIFVLFLRITGVMYWIIMESHS